jgi:uncharacterized protein (DUF924 family)
VQGGAPHDDIVLLTLAQAITDAFSNDVAQLAAGAYDSWLQEPLSAVAGIILADQFTRCVW